MTIITGRRRIGKTTLVARATEGGEPMVYLFVARKNKAALCREFVELISTQLGVHAPEVVSFRELFYFLMKTGKNRRFNLVIDECQEFANINPSIFSDMQNIWDSYRDVTHVNLLLMGSGRAMMHKIFEDYSIVRRVRPLLSKPRRQNVRYEINDNFLKFWFTYFYCHQAIVELHNFDVMRNIVAVDYPMFSGRMLERWFMLKMAESRKFVDLGGWWKKGSEVNEIAIVGLLAEKDHAVAVEVKRQRKNFRPELLSAKAERLKATTLRGYTIDERVATLDDM